MNQYNTNVKLKFGSFTLFGEKITFNPNELQLYVNTMYGCQQGIAQNQAQFPLMSQQKPTVQPKQELPTQTLNEPPIHLKNKLSMTSTQIPLELNPPKKPRLGADGVEEWESFQTIFDESRLKIQQIDNANKQRYEQLLAQKDSEIADLQKIISELNDQIKGIQRSKQQLCCNECGNTVEKVVYCSETCHEEAIKKRFQLKNDLEN